MNLVNSEDEEEEEEENSSDNSDFSTHSKPGKKNNTPTTRARKRDVEDDEERKRRKIVKEEAAMKVHELQVEKMNKMIEMLSNYKKDTSFILTKMNMLGANIDELPSEKNEKKLLYELDALEALQEALSGGPDPEWRDMIRRVMVAIFTELGADDPVSQSDREVRPDGLRRRQRQLSHRRGPAGSRGGPRRRCRNGSRAPSPARSSRGRARHTRQRGSPR